MALHRFAAWEPPVQELHDVEEKVSQDPDALLASIKGSSHAGVSILPK
jgi:hypothetical protein